MTVSEQAHQDNRTDHRKGSRGRTPLRSLRDRGFRGAVLGPGEEGYDEARRVRNAAVDAYPALVARCAGADDVATAVRFAGEQGLALAVRGGGHSVLGHSTLDDGLVVDLSSMKAVRVDPVGRVARVAAGLTWSELDAATTSVGLATPGASVGSVGVAGMTLLGGFGHLMRRHGLSVDNLRAADVVTADGRRLRVDGEHHPDLFWALRGGGGGFGVVTALEYDLHPVGPLVLGGLAYWPLEQAAEVLDRLGELAPDAPDELGVGIVAHRAPPLPFVPLEVRGRPVIGLLLTWCGALEAGRRVVDRLLSVGRPAAEQVRAVPYRAVQALLDGSVVPGQALYWRSHRLPSLTDAVVEELVAAVEGATSPSCLVNGWVVGGAVSRADPTATAVGPREVGFELRLVAQWPGDDPEPERHRAWVRSGWEQLRPHTRGQQYATFLSDEGEAGLRAAFAGQLPRLQALKARWDPAGVFRSCLPITPNTPNT